MWIIFDSENDGGQPKTHKTFDIKIFLVKFFKKKFKNLAWMTFLMASMLGDGGAANLCARRVMDRANIFDFLN